MKWLVSAIVTIALVLPASLANAVTYTFTTDPYAVFVPDAGTGNAFSPGMFISGTITTAAPLPPNLNNQDIVGLITAYSFNDGIRTFNNSNSGIHSTLVDGFSVNTDSAGNITDAFFLIMSTVPENVVNAPVDYIAFGDGYHAYNDMNCLSLSAQVPPLCSGIEFLLNQSSRVVSNVLRVTREQQPGTGTGAVAEIPTLPQLGLLLLVVCMGAVGLFLAGRRNSDPRV